LPLLSLALGGIGLPGGTVYINKRSLRSPPSTQPGLGERHGRDADRPHRPAGDPVRRGRAHQLLALRRAGVPGLPAAHALVFNLLPVPGPDGWGILAPWLPRKRREFGWRTVAIAPLLSIVLLLLPPVNRAFWDGVYALSHISGLDAWAIGGGRATFEFWRRGANGGLRASR
jgi:hypothetical protein